MTESLHESVAALLHVSTEGLEAARRYLAGEIGEQEADAKLAAVQLASTPERIERVCRVVEAAMVIAEVEIMHHLSTDEPLDCFWDALGNLRAAIKAAALTGEPAP